MMRNFFLVKKVGKTWGKPGENPGKTRENWGKPGKTGENRGKPGKTGENRGILGKTGETPFSITQVLTLESMRFITDSVCSFITKNPRVGLIHQDHGKKH